MPGSLRGKINVQAGGFTAWSINLLGKLPYGEGGKHEPHGK